MRPQQRLLRLICHGYHTRACLRAPLANGDSGTGAPPGAAPGWRSQKGAWVAAPRLQGRAAGCPSPSRLGHCLAFPAAASLRRRHCAVGADRWPRRRLEGIADSSAELPAALRRLPPHRGGESAMPTPCPRRSSCPAAEDGERRVFLGLAGQRSDVRLCRGLESGQTHAEDQEDADAATGTSSAVGSPGIAGRRSLWDESCCCWVRRPVSQPQARLRVSLRPISVGSGWVTPASEFDRRQHCPAWFLWACWHGIVQVLVS